MQNHGMAEVGRHLSRSASATTLLNQCHSHQIAWRRVQLCFHCLQGWRPTAFLGNLLQCSVTLAGKKGFSLCLNAVKESQNRSITECLRLGRTCGGPLTHVPCSSTVTYSRLLRTVSWQLLNTFRYGDSTTSLGNLFQCSVTHRVKTKKTFPDERW